MLLLASALKGEAADADGSLVVLRSCAWRGVVSAGLGAGVSAIPGAAVEDEDDAAGDVEI